MTKIGNITPALIRKVNPSIISYKNPPRVSPMMLASPPKLPATSNSMDMKDGHIRPLPTANSIAAPPTETILFDTNKTKFVPKIKLPMMTNFSSENLFSARN
jgi:hypothetical protein